MSEFDYVTVGFVLGWLLAPLLLLLGLLLPGKSPLPAWHGLSISDPCHPGYNELTADAVIENSRVPMGFVMPRPHG